MTALLLLLLHAAPPAEPTAAQAAGNAESLRLFRRAQDEWQAGKRDQALATMAMARRAVDEALGPDAVNARRQTDWLAEWAKQAGRLEESAAHSERQWSLTARLYGADHHHAVDARGRWELAKRLISLTPAQRGRLAAADRAHERASALHREGDARAALPLFAEVLSAREEVLGPRHPSTASALHNVSLMHTLTGDDRKALALARRALAIEKDTLGTGHPAYALGLHNLAMLLMEQGDPEAAAASHRQALAVFRAAHGPHHPECAMAMNSLAMALDEAGDLDASLTWFRRAAGLRAELLGEKDAEYAKSLSGLAGVLLQRGEFREALALQQRATGILRAALGPKHPHHATALAMLAQVLAFSEDQAGALALHKEACAGLKAALGERHHGYAAALHVQAEMLARSGAADEALPLHQRAMSIRKAARGVRHPEYADSLAGLAEAHFFRGEFSEALPLHEKALAVYRSALGEDHPRHAAALNNLAATLLAAGEAARARVACERALAHSAARLRGAASLRADRQFLAALHLARGRLDLRLSLPDADAYGHLLAWKGAAMLRQQERRLHTRLAADPATRAAAERLQKVAARLAALTWSGAAGRKGEAEGLHAEQERLQAGLSRRPLGPARAEWPRKPETLANALPEGAVLIDYLFFLRHGLAGKGGRPLYPFPVHGIAFVVRRGRPVARVDLGPAADLVAAANAWRAALVSGRPDAEAGLRLKRLIWTPLEKHLDGAKMALISPDGVLGMIPFAALPGEKAGSYLIEEMAVAVVPVPQSLPEMLAPAKDGGRPPPSLLAVGGLDYGEEGRGFAALPGAAEEALAVRASFGRAFAGAAAISLGGGRATKAAIREALGEVRYAHLATHGFFSPRGDAAPAGREGTPPGRHPLLFSGLALSGANRPAKEGAEDGILTALEVSEMDLSRLELAVLSACETGLGKAEKGEGLLGMQRAFQLAGARSVVSSLWKVDDGATRRLMGEMYAAAWGARKAAGHAEALRAAQLAMLNARPGDGRLRGVGLKPEAVAGMKGGKRLPPYYWAAFVLSGDWR